MGRMMETQTQTQPKLGQRELETLQREAWEAFEYETSRGKTDSLGRIWSFEPTTRGGVLTIDFHLHRPSQKGVGEPLSAPLTNFRALRPQSDALILRLDEAVA